MPGDWPVWYFDPVSPNAYLALPGVMKLTGGNVDIRPVALHVLIQHWAQRPPIEIPQKAKHIYRSAYWAAKQAGRPLRVPSHHPFRSTRVSRLLCAVGAEPSVVTATLEFIWANGIDPSTSEAFSDLAQVPGIEDPESLIRRQDGSARLRWNTEAALQAGVFGVPTLVLSGELFWGLDALPMAEAFLANPHMLADGRWPMPTNPFAANREVAVDSEGGEVGP